jgi:HK97 gp10 family phage protein
MNDEVISISGLKEVQKALYSYSQQLGDRVVIMALKKGAAVVRRAIQDIVPVKTGKLKQKGFTISRSKIYRGRAVEDKIGVYLTIRHKKKGDPYYGRFQNDGWRAGKTKVPGKRFMQIGFNNSKGEAVRVIVADAKAGADVLARKVGL